MMFTAYKRAHKQLGLWRRECWPLRSFRGKTFMASDGLMYCSGLNLRREMVNFKKRGKGIRTLGGGLGNPRF